MLSSRFDHSIWMCRVVQRAWKCRIEVKFTSSLCWCLLQAVSLFQAAAATHGARSKPTHRTHQRTPATFERPLSIITPFTVPANPHRHRYDYDTLAVYYCTEAVVSDVKLPSLSHQSNDERISAINWIAHCAIR